MDNLRCSIGKDHEISHEIEFNNTNLCKWADRMVEYKTGR